MNYLLLQLLAAFAVYLHCLVSDCAAAVQGLRVNAWLFFNVFVCGADLPLDALAGGSGGAPTLSPAPYDAAASKRDDDEVAATWVPIVSGSSSAAARFPLSVGRAPSRRKLLLFDLDDTLIVSNVNASAYGIPPSFSEVVPSARGAELFHVWARAGLRTFLRMVSEHFTVGVFTAGAASYASPIIDRIDPDRVLKVRLFRDACACVSVRRDSQGRTITLETPTGVASSAASQASLETKSEHRATAIAKDLQRAGVHLASVVLVDNYSDSFVLQPFNGIHIRPFIPPAPCLFSARPESYTGVTQRLLHNAAMDPQLVALAVTLRALAQVKDVRQVLAHQCHAAPYVSWLTSQSNKLARTQTTTGSDGGSTTQH